MRELTAEELETFGDHISGGDLEVGSLVQGGLGWGTMVVDGDRMAGLARDYGYASTTDFYNAVGDFSDMMNDVADAWDDFFDDDLAQNTLGPLGLLGIGAGVGALIGFGSSLIGELTDGVPGVSGGEILESTLGGAMAGLGGVAGGMLGGLAGGPGGAAAGGAALGGFFGWMAQQADSLTNHGNNHFVPDDYEPDRDWGA